MQQIKITPLTQEQQELAATYYPLAIRIAHRIAKRNHRHHFSYRVMEYESAVCQVLVNAARTFRHDGGAKFLRYFDSCLIDVMRFVKADHVNITMTKPLIDDMTATNYTDGFGELVELIPLELDREIVYRRFVLRESLPQIGESLGVSRQRIHQRLTRAYALLREKLQ